MTKRYSCYVCGEYLVPQYEGGAIARYLQHGPSSCPNSNQKLKYGSDTVTVKDEPVIMLGTGLSYKSAGIKRYFQCDLVPEHADYHRGEISDIDRPDLKPWKRCTVPGCNGRMDLLSVHLRLDGSTEPFERYARKPKPEVSAAVEAIILNEQQMLRKFMRKMPKGKFRRIKVPNSTKRIELVEKGAVAYRRKGTAFSSKITVIADSESQSLIVALYGCAGTSLDVKAAARKAHLPVDVIVRPSIKTPRKRSKK